MKRKFVPLVAVGIVLVIAFGAWALNGSGERGFKPEPQTAYARTFIQKCENQQWFMDEIERILNQDQKSINTMEDVSELDIVKAIGLKNQDIEGKIPEAVGELKELRYIFLSGNQLSGKLPEELFSLPKLKNIDLSGNQYKGDIPDAFGDMPALTMLALNNNQFDGTIPEKIMANTQIEYLDVSANELSGAIPAGLNQMVGLEYLNISQNPWDEGIFPVGLDKLSKLKVFSAWDCNIKDNLPQDIYAMTNLQILDLANNSFSGEISSEIGNLTNLQLLALGNNQVEGVIPAELGNLNLDKLDLSNNKLRGTVPAPLAEKAKNGTELFMENNYMTGEALKGLTHNENNFTDNATSNQYRLTANEQVQIYRSLYLWC